MTTIAFDGKTLAADKRASSQGLVFTVTKVRKIRGHMVAASGAYASIQELLAWYSAGADASKLPEFQRTDDFVNLLIIDEKGGIFELQRGPIPFKVEEKFYAIGSGRDFAIAAMHLGCNAVDAVKVAAVFDSGTGNGVDTLTLEPAFEQSPLVDHQ